jgi:acetoacetate decarboxylase
MGYKHKSENLTTVKTALASPNFLLKIIPHVDGTPRICELVEYYLNDITVKGAWTGPAALDLRPHALLGRPHHRRPDPRPRQSHLRLSPLKGVP